MLNIRVQTMVAALVRQLLVDTGGKDGEALHLQLDLGMGYYKNDPMGARSYRARYGLHLLFHRKPGSGYVDTFSAITDSLFVKHTEIAQWTHETSHDTCWRDIQVFSQLYFRMAVEINSAMSKDGFPEVAPAEMTEHNSFALFESMWRWLPAEVSYDSTDPHHYRRIITLNPPR